MPQNQFQIPPDLVLSVRPMSNVDIDLVRAHLHCHVMGRSTQSAPRHWLNAQENQQVASQVDAFWAGIDSQYLKMAKLPLGDRALVEDFSHSVFSTFRQQVDSDAQNSKRFFGFFHANQVNPDGSPEIPVFDPLPYSNNSAGSRKSKDAQPVDGLFDYKSRDVSQCVARDLERGWQAFFRLRTMEELSEERKKAITRNLNESFERSVKERSSIPGSGMSGHAEEMGVLKFSLGELKSLNDKLVSQEDIDQRRLKLSERFGFDGVTISSSLLSTPREHARWIDSAEKSLEQACRRLGIEECCFAMDGRSSFEIDSPQTGLQKNAQATFSAFSKNNARINFSASTVDGPAVLVHEYTHHLENVLALMAVEAAPELFSNKENFMLFFSELTLRQKSVLPLANEGLKQICQQTHQPTPNTQNTLHALMDQVSSWFAKNAQGVGVKNEPVNRMNGAISLNSPNISISSIGSVGNPHPDPSDNPLDSLQVSELVEKALNRFALFHLGPQGFLKMASKEYAQYKDSLTHSATSAVLEMAKGWSRLPMESICACLDSPNATGAHMDIARKLHGPRELDLRKNAILAIEPMLVSLNARLNLLTESAVSPNPPGASGCAKKGRKESHVPGIMMEASVRMDRQRIDAGYLMDYYAQPKEMLARIVSRPHGFMEVSKKLHLPHEVAPMGHGQLRELSRGLEKMIDCAGVPRKNSPALSALMEPQKFIIAKASDDFVKAVAKFVPRLNAMFAVNREKCHAPKI